jgi:DNA repair photolyase
MKQKPKLVVLPPRSIVIADAEGFKKKELATYHVDLLALCQFKCRFCSSNEGNVLRIGRKKYALLTEQQWGTAALPSEDRSLMYMYADVVETLTEELRNKPKSYGAGFTVVFSMLTDGFSPELVKRGITEDVLTILLERTSFRIRILTKNAVVGQKKWIKFFLRYRNRIVVGLSTGTTDNAWAREFEAGTSSPTARIRALKNLQEAGIATYAMWCPVFPESLETGRLDDLIDRSNPLVCETIWSEPYNNRTNWRFVQAGFEPGSPGWDRMTEMFENRKNGAWSAYATALYLHLRRKAKVEGWLDRLRYLLYEHLISETDAREFAGLDAVLLQSPTDADGLSKHPVFRALQLAKMRRSA